MHKCIYFQHENATPTITLASNASNVTANSTLVLTATVTDTNSITKVEFYKGATLLATDISSPYSTSVPVTSADNGTLNFTAKLTDSASNVITSANCAVVVNITDAPPVVADTQAPTISLTSSMTSVTTEQTITLTATAADNVGVTKVEFYKNGLLAGTVTAAPYTLAQHLANTDNGTINYSAIAYDAAGNSKASNTVAVTVSVAAPAPITTLSMTSDLNTAINTARDGAALGTKRVAVAQSILTTLQPSHVLNVYRNNVLICGLTFAGDCTVNDDGTNVTVGLGNIASTSTTQSADINTGTWTFAVIGGSSNASKIQGTVGPVGSGANLILSESPSTDHPFDATVSFTIPRSVDGYAS